MKQQETFKWGINMVQKTLFFGVALFLSVFLLAQQVFAADPTIWWDKESIQATTSLVGGKKVSSVSFTVYPASFPSSDLFFVNISNRNQIEQRFELSSFGAAQQVAFSNLLPNTLYTVSASYGQFSPNQGGNYPNHKLRDLPNVIGYFTSPDGDAPGETQFFSYSKQPESSALTDTNGSSIIVKLYIKSTVDQTASVVISKHQDAGTVAQTVTFKKNETSLVTFPYLSPSSRYNVMIANYVPSTDTANGRYQQVAALDPFYSAALPYTPSPNPTSTPTPTPSPTPSLTPPSGTVVTIARGTDAGPRANLGTTCTDGIDNDGDGRADYYGTATMDPDPSCFSATAEEIADDVAAGSLVPCTNKCGLRDVFVLLNNVLKFVISKLLVPLFVVLLMYIGYRYLTAMGKPGMHAELKKMLWSMVIGLALILTAWLIVRTLLVTLGYSDGLLFFD